MRTFCVFGAKSIRKQESKSKDSEGERRISSRDRFSNNLQLNFDYFRYYDPVPFLYFSTCRSMLAITICSRFLGYLMPVIYRHAFDQCPSFVKNLDDLVRWDM